MLLTEHCFFRLRVVDQTEFFFLSDKSCMKNGSLIEPQTCFLKPSDILIYKFEKFLIKLNKFIKAFT